jgi:hypothetical protein
LLLPHTYAVLGLGRRLLCAEALLQLRVRQAEIVVGIGIRGAEGDSTVVGRGCG